MNLFLIEPEEQQTDGTVRLRDRRLSHAREVLKLAVGDHIRAGIVGGASGTATVLSLDTEELVVQLELSEPPPPRPGLDLVLAMPRPLGLKRILQTVAQLGVDRVVLLCASRVERSYFSSPVLEAGSIRKMLIEGLEQARDTILPTVIIRERFRPFVEDEAPVLFADSTRLLAHPNVPRTLEQLTPGPRTVLAVGPEGGWIPFEIDLWQRQGFVPFSLGPRILRTETLIPYLIGALRQPALQR